MDSVSLSLLMASWGDGLDRDRCLDLELDPELEPEPELELGLELDELDEPTLNIFEILLIFEVILVTLIKNPTDLKYRTETGSREKVAILDSLLFR